MNVFRIYDPDILHELLQCVGHHRWAKLKSYKGRRTLV